MAVIRVKHLDFETKFRIPEGADTLNQDEWAGADNRVNEAGWGSRYEYEGELVSTIIKETGATVILEIGPGPGVLSEIVQNRLGYEVEYHLVDKPYAKTAFEAAGRKGEFFIKDISEGFDTSRINACYDMVICNDTLEHLLNPSRVVQEIYHLIPKGGTFFISVPNWRMGHQFVYRGVFDYDNFLFFMMTHKFIATGVYPSPLQTPDYAKLSSEDEMEEELRRSWNWYFTFTPDK
jgi:2-polyprenyl-3-methyl-5-hydroxy-6-metoxy-1,4-benzoquinol methylase